jgi:hypothetical protein
MTRRVYTDEERRARKRAYQNAWAMRKRRGAGIRPRVYLTDEERRTRRRDVCREYNRKRRRAATEAAAAAAAAAAKAEAEAAAAARRQRLDAKWKREKQQAAIAWASYRQHYAELAARTARLRELRLSGGTDHG